MSVLVSVVVSFALTSVVTSTPLECTVDDGYGRKQAWVPNCIGTGCFANNIDNDCAWVVYDVQSCVALHGDECYVLLDARSVQNVTSYAVTSGVYQVEGYQCSGNTTYIYYPRDSTGPFPVVVYLHGSGGGVDGRHTSFAQVAAYGIIVIAPYTGSYSSSCSSESEWRDAVTAIHASMNGGGANLSEGLEYADWSKQGIWGYSMGGRSAPAAATSDELNISALVCSHGARRSGNVTAPSLYLTGAWDDSSSTPDVMLHQFDLNSASYKAFVNLRNATHDWPKIKGTMTPWVGKFFACHLAGKESHCNDIYGDGANSLCSAHDYAQCTTVTP